jgi:Na+-translocating ferredoxin:NAD+ oxidoreductase RnfG subunit
MTTLVEFLKVLAIFVAILFLLAIAYSIIETFINHITSNKAKKQFKENMQDIFEKLIEEIEQEELEEKEKKQAKKVTRKPRKTKEKKEENK